MKAGLLALVIGVILTGCASMRQNTVREMGEGAALPREVFVDPALLPVERDPGRDWSVRDFMQPRGLVR